MNHSLAHVVFSGGPSDGNFHEIRAMKVYPARTGVPPLAIWLDPNGLKTRAILVNSLELLNAHFEFGRIITVSEFDHLSPFKHTANKTMRFQQESARRQETTPIAPFSVAFSPTCIYFARSMVPPTLSNISHAKT